MRGVVLFLLLVTAWALWSGHYSLEPLIFAFGLGSCLFVTWLVLRMDRMVDWLPETDRLPGLGFVLRLPRYLFFLFLQVCRSSIRVSRLILDPTMPMTPHLLRAKASQETAWGQVIHANSITLTPGTLTLDLRDGELLVHALDPISASSVESGAIDAAVCRLEGSA